MSFVYIFMSKFTINLPEKDLINIREYCKKFDVKISSLFRQGAKKIIHGGY